MDKFGRIECLFEDWDDTTFPRPTCHCRAGDDNVDCANVPDDVESCPNYKQKHPDMVFAPGISGIPWKYK